MIKKNPILFLFLILFFFLNIFNNNLYFDLEFDLNSSPSLLISINCNNEDCERAFLAYNEWGKELISLYSKIKIIFTTTAPNKNSNFNFFVVKKKEGNWRQIWYNNLDLYEYFITFTDYDYLFRTTEDVFINSILFVNYFKTFLPYNNKYILIGQLLEFREFFLLHGGPGWIMNRETVKVILDNKNYFQSIYNNKYAGDDVFTFDFINFLNLSLKDVHTNKFLGPFISDEIQNKLIEKNFIFENCRNSSKFYQQPQPLNEVIVWHSGTKNNFIVENAKSFLPFIPKNLYFHSNIYTSYLCLKQ